MKHFDMFTTTAYRYLRALYDHSTKLKNGNIVVPITQAEIAAEIGVNKVTANRTFKELQNFGLVDLDGNVRGRYVLKENSYGLLKTMAEVEDKYNNRFYK